MNIYVGNLSHKAVDEDVKNLFSEHGQVDSAKVIKDKYTGNSRGFAFVEMPVREQALAAIEKLNGKEFMTRPLTVNEARPRPERPRDGGGRGGDRGGFGRR